MKYIKTNDGIFESSHPNKVIIYKELIPKHNGTFQIVDYEGEIQAGAIIAEAYTIEELCDELVIKHISNEKPYLADDYQKHNILEDRQKVFDCGVEEVKGAIWTLKGLIYVAKLNNKGELELI